MIDDPGRPIVCCIDFSENAARAAVAAAALAARCKRPLTLLHVADEFDVHADTPEQRENYLQPIRAKLQAEASRLGASGITVSVELLHGKAAEEAILEFLAERSVRFVVVSAVSKTAFDRWTIGSVSERVAQEGSAVTLVVRDSAPFEAWARGQQPLKVFVAMDSSASAEAALRWVVELRKFGPCEVTAGFVNMPEEERERLGVRAPAQFLENVPEVQQILERDLREKVASILGADDARIRVLANSGRVDAPLVELARNAQTDLFVVGAHQRHGLDRLVHGSVSRGILRHAPMSVACVPATAVPAPAPGARLCHRVLVAVDISENGGMAVPHAYSVVNEGGTVNLVHIVPSSHRPNPLLGTLDVAPSTHRTSVRKVRGSAQIRSLIPPEAEARGIKSEVEVIEHEDVVTAICQAAEAMNADLVCVGANERPSAAARVMGSVALGVLQKCHRPVLVVWPPSL